MFSWVKIIQGLVALADWVTRKLERQEYKNDGKKEQQLADDEAKLNLQKNVRAIDNAFDANADRMSKLYGSSKNPGDNKQQ